MSFILFCCVSFLVGSEHPVTKDPTNLQINIDCQLVDNSRIVGKLVDLETPFSTRTGKTYLRDADRIRFLKNANKVRLEWQNGDRLHATTNSKSIKVDTAIGRLEIPLQKIRVAQISRIERKPLKPVAVFTSGQYAHHKTEYAFDGSLGNSWSSGDWKGWIELDLGEEYSLSEFQVHLQFAPAGDGVHDLYISKEPMKNNRAHGIHLRRFHGKRKDKDVLRFSPEKEVRGRYVQIHCVSSRAWFNVREFEVFPVSPLK